MRQISGARHSLEALKKLRWSLRGRAELFNEVMDHHFEGYEQISDEGRVQIARAVGCGTALLFAAGSH